MYLTPSLFKCHHRFLGQFFVLTVQKIGYGLVRKAVSNLHDLWASWLMEEPPHL